MYRPLTFMSDLAANMIGRSNARRGARRMFAVLQNRRLNQHIAYTVVDEVRNLPYISPYMLIFRHCHQVFAALFPESNLNP